MTKKKEPCVLYSEEKDKCVGLKVKTCDRRGNTTLPEGDNWVCPFYKSREDEIESQRKAMARCEITGYMFVANDKIDLEIDE